MEGRGARAKFYGTPFPLTALINVLESLRDKSHNEDKLSCEM
jgi:hypothetical protein